MKWTITMTYDAHGDKGNIRSTSVYWVEAPNVGAAYKKAEEDWANVTWPKNIKFGSIIPGHIEMAPGLYQEDKNARPVSSTRSKMENSNRKSRVSPNRI